LYLLHTKPSIRYGNPAFMGPTTVLKLVDWWL